jgi:glucokinase
MVMVTLGTGVGGAVINDGRLLIGANGSAADSVTCGSSVAVARAWGRTAASSSTRRARLQRELRHRRGRGIGERLAAHRDADGIVHGPTWPAPSPRTTLVPSRRCAAWPPRSERPAGVSGGSRSRLHVIGGGVADLGEVLLEPTRLAYETRRPGSATDRPRARHGDARQRCGDGGVADLADRISEPSGYPRRIVDTDDVTER